MSSEKEGRDQSFIQSIIEPFQTFIHTEAAGGIAATFLTGCRTIAVELAPAL